MSMSRVFNLLKVGIVGAAVAGAIWTHSPDAEQHVRRWEGEVRQSYADPYWGWKVPTVCVGNTKHARKGFTATAEQCQQYLKEDLAVAGSALRRSLEPHGVRLTQGEVDAYTSFILNLGETKWKKSTSVYGRLLAGDHKGACAGLKLYVYSNKQYSRGLAYRRTAEYKLCMKDL